MIISIVGAPRRLFIPPMIRVFHLLLPVCIAVVSAGAQARVPAPYFSAPKSEPAYEPPAGYYDTAEGLVGDALKGALHQIIRGHTPYPYSSSSIDTWDILKDADRDPNNTNNVLLFYNGVSVNGPQEFNGGSGWNREHVWPKKQGTFDEGDVPGRDVHNLRACDISVNSRRDSLEFDNGGAPVTIKNLVGTFADADSFEPNDSFKGDVARIIFYMDVRYEGNGELELEVDDLTDHSTNGTLGKISTLLEWHLLDPVDDFERRRNARIASFQGNRNPFIDRPDWARAVFDPNYAPPNFAVEPAAPLSVSGLAGGPFDPLQHVFTVVAGGEQGLSWEASADVRWLSLSPNGGLLEPGSRADLSVFVNSAEMPTEPGAYVGTVRFRNTVTGATVLRQIVATVLPPARLAVSSSGAQTIRGPVGGPFEPTSWVYSVSNIGATPMDWVVLAPEWLNLSASGGRLEPGQATTVSASANATATGYVQGVYNGEIAFTNSTNGDGNTSLPVRLEVGRREYFTQRFEDPALFDLANKSVTFTPDGSADFYRTTVRSASSFPTDPTTGTNLLLNLDESREVAVAGGKSVLLYGEAYTRFFVGSPGYVTFTQPDIDYTPTLQDHFRLARISGLFFDLNPPAGGSVLHQQFADRIAVTYLNVPEYPATGSNSFQIEMFFDGRIRITWLGVGASAPAQSLPPMVGLSRGGGLPEDFQPSDFSSFSTETLFVNSFSPASGLPGALVTITGAGFEGVKEVLFGGVPAAFAVVDSSRVQATVPPAAVSGTITVVAEALESESATDFHVTRSPSSASLAGLPSALSGFSAFVGTASAAQEFFVSATALPGPLVIVAPEGFQVSVDGQNFAGSVQLQTPLRTDRAANYGASWDTGSNRGYGFGPWNLSFQNGLGGAAAAFIGDPSLSGLLGMASTAFALTAAVESSGAAVTAARSLERPLAIGESFSFDWGVNWDSGAGLKGFEILSGTAVLSKVEQNGFPGPIAVYDMETPGAIDAGLAFGVHPMRWTFRQLDAQTLRITATGREGSSEIAFSRDIGVTGAVSGFRWFALAMAPDVLRHSFFDRLAVESPVAGGGDLPPTAIHVRLAAGAVPGAVSGQVALTSNGENFATVGVSGTVTAASSYDLWAQSHGFDPQGNGARGADADCDGHSNLHEFLFGTLPVEATGSLWRHEMKGSDLVLTFVGRETGATYKLMSTGNLASGMWEEMPTTVLTDQEGVPAGHERRQAVVPKPSGNRFFRLQAAEAQ